MNVQFFAGIRVATLVACWSFLAWISAMVATAFAGDIDALVLARVPDRPTREPATSLAIENDMICVGYRDAGVQLLDISNPANPRPMAMLSGMGRVNDVALAGGFL